MASVVHSIPGRLRLRVDELRTDPDLLDELRRVAGSAGATVASVNPRAGSVVLRYDPAGHGAEAVIAALAAAGLLGGTRVPVSGIARGFAHTLGLAIGTALFNAAWRSGVERSVGKVFGPRRPR